MNKNSLKRLIGTITLLFLAAGSVQAQTYNFDPNWTKSQCATYSLHGLWERYVYAKSYGWIDNDSWDSATTEGVDCSAYVPRCLAIPEFRGEHVSIGHLYYTGSMYNGGLVVNNVQRAVKLNGYDAVQPWDWFVWRKSAHPVGSTCYNNNSTGHTGMIKETVGSTMYTREALCSTCGVIPKVRTKQEGINNCYNYWRRKDWGDSNPIPERPTSLSATAIAWNKVDLKWVDNSSNETGFEIQKSSTSATAGFSTFHTTGNNIKAWTAGNLAEDTTYWFRVRAINANGNSAWSGVAHDKTFDRYPPAAPSGLTATAVNDDKITLTWTDNSNNEDEFDIQQSTDAVTWTLIKETSPNATSFSVTNLVGNKLYYFRVRSQNEAGASVWSNTASDTTAPRAPSNLVATKKSSSKINVSWTDNSGSEAGFKVERGTSASGPWTQFTNVAANITLVSDTGLAGGTTYWYRVRSYNANGNSLYSNTDSATTDPIGPVIDAIGDKTVVATSNLLFRVTSTDPNLAPGSVNWGTFAGFANGQSGVLFKKPDYANATVAFVDTSVTNYCNVVSSYPTGHASARVLKAKWNFKTGQTNPYMKLSTDTADTAHLRHPTLLQNQSLRFDIHSDKNITVGFDYQETGTSAAIGEDGGNTGELEWIGVTNVVSGSPFPSTFVAAGSWQTVTLNIQKDPIMADTGDGIIPTGGKGTMRNLIIKPQGTMGAYTVFFDNFKVYTNNWLNFSLLNAPSGCTINSKSGDIRWTPTAGQVGSYNISVKVTDQLGLADTNTFTVTVTGTGNAAPVLAPIGDKTVNELTALTFTATATDVNAGQTKTFSLDAGYPTGASINASSGAFTWTPTEAQGPGTYPITVRVTDNGSPVSNDFETITVTVDEVNVAPTIATIANQTINEGSTFNYTVSGSDADVPANTVTYSLVTAPVGLTINTNSGAISWVTGESNGPATNQVTVRATDNGVPRLWADRTFNLTVNEVNVSPSLTVSNAASTTAIVTDFEHFETGSANGTVLFRAPGYSGSTSTYLDTALANSTTIITNSPGGEQSTMLKASFAWKTGQTNPWLRLTTYNLTGASNSLPNPTVDSNRRLKFKIYSDKSVKICLGIKETGTSAPIGANGGTSGTIEFVGATGKNGTAPICTRTVAANTWTTVDFDLPNEPAVGLTGDGILAPGKSVLECVALVPNGGTGVHNVYFDDLIVYSGSTNITVNAGEEVRITCTSADTDLPEQTLTYSLVGAPAGATIDEAGTFSWIPTPAQAPSTNIITIRVTDDGSPALSASQNITIKVARVNTPPRIAQLEDDVVIENGTGQTASFDVSAEDDDLPAQTLTYSLTAAPAGATIGSISGTVTWTPPSGTSTNYVTIRVTDNGVPPLYDEVEVAIKVVPTNNAPVLSLGTGRITEPFANYESFTNNTPNGAVMFRNPDFSGSTTEFLGTQTNYTRITNGFPAGNPTGSGSKVLRAQWNFKTGTANYWLRLTTSGAASLLNPTVDLAGRVKFDIYTTKALKVGLGIKETGTTAEIGDNGGTGTVIEWIGVTNVVTGNEPVPSRLVPANTWTTLEFNLPAEPCVNFSGGNGVLASGKGVLEHLALRGEGGTGVYIVYLDNFQVVTTAALPSTVTVKTGSTLSFTASATDPNPGTGIYFGLNADFQEAHTNAVIDQATGVFSWTPVNAEAGTTNVMTVSAEDAPTNGGIVKSDSKTFTVIVNADPFTVQSGANLAAVSAGETVSLTWAAVPGTTYAVQSKDSLDSDSWTDIATVTADSTEASIEIANDGTERFYRIVEVNNGGASAE